MGLLNPGSNGNASKRRGGGGGGGGEEEPALPTHGVTTSATGISANNTYNVNKGPLRVMLGGREGEDSGRGRGEESVRGRALEDFELPETDFGDDLEGSFYKQIKRWAIETIYGRPNNKLFSDSSASHAMNMSMMSLSTTNSRLLHSEALVAQSHRQRTVSPYVLSPDNGFLLVWEQLIMVLAAYSAFMTPFEFAFYNVPPVPLRVVDTVVNAFFLVELILTFFVAFIDKKTYVFISDHKRIASRYLSTWFFLDLVAIIPWDECYVAAGADWNGWQQIFRWLTWVRVLRARRVLRYFKRLQRDIRLSYFMVRIVKLLVVELYITHVAGCIFYFLALTYPPEEESLTWIGSLTLGGNAYTNFRDLPLGTLYVTSMYWSIVTMATIGYGDIHPVNPREMIFAMVYITCDLILSAYLVGNITALVVKGSNTTRYRERMAALIKYMNRNHLPPILRHQMRQHVRLQFETEQVEDEILQEFPLSIRHKVARALYRRTVEDCYLFANCSGEFVNQIVARAVPEYFFPSEVIVLQRDAAEHMYIIISGLVEEQGSTNLTYSQRCLEVDEFGLTHDAAQDLKPEPTSLVQGMAFGEVALLCNIPQPFSVVAKELSQVLRIEKDVLQSVISMFIIDGRRIVENLLERTNEEGSKFSALSSEIRNLIAQQEAELTMSTIYAASRGDIEHLKDLVKAGANPSKADYDGRSPLHLAAAGGFDEVVSFLIREGADVNFRDNFGTTPLLEALRAGNDATASLIMEKGGSVSLQEAGTDLCNAVINGDTGLLKRLLQHGVDPNSADYDLRTPLHIASAEGFLMLAKILVENGADVLARDRWGNTALDEARRCGSLPLVRYLEDAIARKAGARAASRGQSPIVPSSPRVAHLAPQASEPAAAAAALEAELRSQQSEGAGAGAGAGLAEDGGNLGEPSALDQDSSTGGGTSHPPTPVSAPLGGGTSAAAGGAAAVAVGGSALAASKAVPASPGSALGMPLALTTGNVALSSASDLRMLDRPQSQTPSEMSRPPSNLPSPGSSPGRGRKATGMPPRRSYGRPGYSPGFNAGGAGGDYSPKLHTSSGKRRVTLYPFPPWEKKVRRVGRVVWLPDSLPELLDAARKAFNRQDFNHVLSADGGDIVELDLILDTDRLYLASDKDMQDDEAES